MDARELLGQVYRSYTEGFDTADLEDAKAMLDKVSADASAAIPAGHS
jgi:hypothetical protein